jgi:hypothetical protein
MSLLVGNYNEYQSLKPIKVEGIILLSILTVFSIEFQHLISGDMDSIT